MSKEEGKIKPYPSLKDILPESIAEIIRFITRERDIDVRDWRNLPQVYLSARKVTRIPSSSADVIDGDKVGDINWTPSYLYILVDNAGTGVWRRVALGSW